MLSDDGAMSSTQNKKGQEQKKPKPLQLGGLGSSNSGKKPIKKSQDDEEEEEEPHHQAQDESFEDKISSKLAGVKTPTSQQSKAPPGQSKASSKNASQHNKLAASSGSE